MDKKTGSTNGSWLFGDNCKSLKTGPAERKPLPENKSARASRPARAASGPGELFGTRKTLAAAICVSALLLIGAVMMTVFLSGEDSIAAMSLGNQGSAKLSLYVVEGYSESPIEGAKVVILETGKVYDTDENGKTQIIEVPVVRDTRFDNIIPKPWGEVSLIVYKDGFLPYALFYLQVMGGQTRKDVKILLFENNSTSSSEPFSIIEGPNRAWVDELVKTYQPQGD